LGDGWRFRFDFCIKLELGQLDAEAIFGGFDSRLVIKRILRPPVMPFAAALKVLSAVVASASRAPLAASRLALREAIAEAIEESL